MKMMKRAMASLMATSMVLSMTACGNSNAANKETAAATPAATEAAATEATGDGSYENCTIKFSWWGGDSRHEATINAVNKFMEKYPGIKVETTYGAWTGWEDSMATMFATNTAPDVNQVNWNWLTSYSADGSAFLDLNTVSDVLDLSQFDQDKLDLCTVADKLQAIPVAMTGRLFYWNKTTFDKAGIAVPTSLADLMAAGQTFKEKLGDDAYPLCLGELDRTILMVFYLESKYGKDWVVDGQLNYSQEEIEEGLAFISSLEEGHVIPTLEKLAGDGAESLDKNPNWMNGNYAGIFEWDSSANKFQGALEEGQEFVVGDYFKDMGDSQGGFTKVSLGLAISANTEHPKESAMLINFLLNEEEGIEASGSERGIPLSKAGLATCQEKGLLDPTINEAHTKVMDWCKFNTDPKFEDATLKSSDGVYYDVMEGLSYGEYDKTTAAETLIDGINTALGN